MPKFLVALVSGALAGMVGFLLGAVFTVPQNKEMEELVNTKAAMVQQIQDIKNENKQLIVSGARQEKQILDLKNRLLRAYEIEKETDSTKTGG